MGAVPEWKQLRNEEGILLYEGYTLYDKPYGEGKSYFSNGQVYQLGEFGIKGLIRGQEFYPHGALRFEGVFKVNANYGPNYPINGACFDEDGVQYYEGKIGHVVSGVGYPTVVNPEQYGPIPQEDRPDVPVFMWEDEDRRKREEGE